MASIAGSPDGALPPTQIGRHSDVRSLAMVTVRQKPAASADDASWFARLSLPSLRDARHWQILSLGVLLTMGLFWLGFDQAPLSVALIVACALATQFVCGRLTGLAAFDPLSPIITALSLSLLLRAGEPWLLGLAAAAAIAAKFVIRIDGKHIFNPANFGIVALLATGQAWISPAQWGSRTWAAFLFASLAGLVLTRARRADVALAFLIAYVGLLFARAAWLGDPWAIPMKQMQSGAVLLFAFFMISDPKTTPDARGLRVLYGVLVAALAAWLQFVRYIPEGLILALFAASPLVPLLDRWRPRAGAERFQWSRPTV